MGDECDDVGRVSLTNEHGEELVAIDAYGAVIRYAQRCDSETLLDIATTLENTRTYPFRYLIVT